MVALLLLLEPISMSVFTTQFSLYDIKDKYSLILQTFTEGPPRLEQSARD